MRKPRSCHSFGLVGDAEITPRLDFQESGAMLYISVYHIAAYYIPKFITPITTT